MPCKAMALRQSLAVTKGNGLEIKDIEESRSTVVCRDVEMKRDEGDDRYGGSEKR
jgi:hypothetical protein